MKKKAPGVEYTVTVKRDWQDFFYTIRHGQAMQVMAEKPENRYAKFIKLAKETKLHSTDTDLSIDMTGNMTEKEFWKEEGDEAWNEMLDIASEAKAEQKK